MVQANSIEAGFASFRAASYDRNGSSAPCLDFFFYLDHANVIVLAPQGCFKG